MFLQGRPPEDSIPGCSPSQLPKVSALEFRRSSAFYFAVPRLIAFPAPGAMHIHRTVPHRRFQGRFGQGVQTWDGLSSDHSFVTAADYRKNNKT